MWLFEQVFIRSYFVAVHITGCFLCKLIYPKAECVPRSADVLYLSLLDRGHCVCDVCAWSKTRGDG